MPRTIISTVKTEAQKEYNQPIYLIELVLSDTTTKYFTNNNEDVNFPSSGGHTYEAWGFSFGDIKSSLTNEIDRVTVDFDNTDLSFSSYLSDYSIQGNLLTISRVFANLLGSASNSVILFKGEVSVPSIDQHKCSLTVISLFHKINILTPRRLFEGDCPWTFDGTECQYGHGSLAAQTTGTTTAGCSTTTIYDTTYRSESDVNEVGYWDYGTITFTSGACNGQSRLIKSFDPGLHKIVLYMPLTATPSLDNYSIKRGCDKSSFACKTLFDNWINFGSFVGLPMGKEHIY